MNNKKWLLFSMFAFTIATIRPSQLELEATVVEPLNTTSSIEAAVGNKKSYYLNLDRYLAKIKLTVLTGSAVGLVTGGTVGYMAGKIFDDAIISFITATMSFYSKDGFFDHQKFQTFKNIMSAVKISVKIGCKSIWSNPLRNKVINWLIDEMKKHSIEVNEELLKTTARLAEFTACIAS